MINHNKNEDENEKQANHIDTTNTPQSRDGHKYSKYKKCIRMMMLIYIEQHFSNI